MSVEVMFVSIAGMGTFLLMIWIIAQAETAKARAKGAPDEVVAKLESVVADTSAEVAKLKDRIRVLERLVTDDDRKLAGEIESLRRTESSPGV